MHYDGLEYLAGYLLRKTDNPQLKSNSGDGRYTFVDHISKGGLWKPSAESMVEFENIEKCFMDCFRKMKEELDNKV